MTVLLETSPAGEVQDFVVNLRGSYKVPEPKLSSLIQFFTSSLNMENFDLIYFKLRISLTPTLKTFGS